MQALADELGIVVTVWTFRRHQQMEQDRHRVFCLRKTGAVGRWSRQTIVQLIAAATIEAGVDGARAELDPNSYPAGVKLPTPR